MRNPELVVVDDEENQFETGTESTQGNKADDFMISCMEVHEINLIEVYGLDEIFALRCFMHSDTASLFESRIHFRNRNFYEGDVVNGWLHGRGKFTFAKHGICYTGEFIRNEATGDGRIDWPDGSFYEGQVVRGIRHGIGTYKHPLGLTYIGEWMNGRKHGKGRMEYNTGATYFYDGQWKEGLRHGFGTYQYAEAAIYEGQWRNGHRSGEGTLHWSDCDEIYTGSWLNGKQHGLGCHAWHILRVHSSQYSLPNVYDGQWENGMRNGLGTFHYPNGSKYVGYWINNLKHGQGTLILKDGRVFERMFHNDRLWFGPGMDDTTRNLTSEILERSDTRLPLIRGNLDESNTGGQNHTQLNNTSDTNLLEHYLRPHIPAEYFHESELRLMQNHITEHLAALRCVYQFYGRLGIEHLPDNTVIMRHLQFCQMIKDCRLHTLTGLARIDQMIDLSFGTEEFDRVQNPERLVSFGAFVNILVILACRLFIKSNVTGEYVHGKKFQNKPSEALIRLITQFLLPNVCKTSSPLYEDRQKSREVLLFIEPVYNVFRFQAEIRKNHGDSPSVITMRHFLLMMKNFSLLDDNLTVSDVVHNLCTINPVAGPEHECNMNTELTFFDFFETLIRIALRPPTDFLAAQVLPRSGTISVSPTLADPSEIKVGLTAEINQTLGHGYKELSDGKIPTLPERVEVNSRRKSNTVAKNTKSGSMKAKDRTHKAKTSTRSNHSSPIPGNEAAINLQNEMLTETTNEKFGDRKDGATDQTPKINGKGSKNNNSLLTETNETSGMEFTRWKAALHQFLLTNLLPAAQHFELCYGIATGMGPSQGNTTRSATVSCNTCSAI
ncbi:Radial spoke head 10 B2 [Fasciola gigantica]|uniref:Radial spoke head 10 B2 n=1 Tax=Fasciola gigantica TaxID=46835 RepID=A0A504Y6C9_FASGI|nr:Radial spoke head 10 B2 [Fasciola gigantica]